MVIKKIFILLTVIIFLVCGCAGIRKTEQEKQSLFQMDVVVQSVQGSSATVLMQYPQLPKNSAVGDLAQDVIRKCLIIEGMKTTINGLPAVVTEVRGETAKLEFTKAAQIKIADVLRLTIPKKNIAVVDFELIKGNQKEAARVTLESLTAALIDSGQFVVVEREKLRTVIGELQLSLSGLTRNTPDQVIGNLFMADLILTGTLAQTGDDWDINLRIVSVRTGQAIAAISRRTKLFSAAEMRDSSSLVDDFEGNYLGATWMQRSFGKRKDLDRAFFTLALDKTQGANNSRGSAKIEFNTPAEMRRSFMIGLRDMKKRDLSFFTGVEFWIKATEELNAQFMIECSQPDDSSKRMRWTSFFPISTSWTKITIPFDKLVVARRWVRQGAAQQGFIPGDQVLRLHRVEDFYIGINTQQNPDSKGAFWVDDIRFY